MPDRSLTSQTLIETPVALPVPGTLLDRPSGMEVVGNWVIDRDFGVVRRRFWGKVPVEGPDFPEL